MSLPSILIGIVLLLIAIPIVTAPLRNKVNPKTLADKGNASGDQNNYESVLMTIRDLDFDHQLGVVSEDDYVLLRQLYLVQAAEAYEQTTLNEGQLEQLIETAVLNRRQHIGNGQGRCVNCGVEQNSANRFCTACGFQVGGACSDCGKPIAQGDNFCTSCGAQMAIVAGASL